MAAVRQHMPIRYTSPNQIDPTVTFTTLLVSVLVGARRFAQVSLLRSDRALDALLGLTRFPTDDTIRNLFRRFGASACLNRWRNGRCSVYRSATRAPP